MKNTILNKRIVVNVTSMLAWNRPVVGIIRTETEFVRFLINEYKGNYVFCQFDKKDSRFYSVKKEDVVKKLDQLVFKHSVLKNEIEKSDSNFGLKSQVKKYIYLIVSRLPIGLANVVLYAFSVFKQIYLKLFLIPKFYIIKFFNVILNKSKRIDVSKKTVISFNNKDHFVSMGLDWDYLDMGYLYTLKKKYSFKVYLFCYDLIPVLYPHLCVFDVANNFCKYFVDLAWCADKVFCISENSKRDFKTFLKMAGCPISISRVVRLGDNVISDGNIEDVSNDIKEVLNKKFVLFVSTIERRKNHETLYKAYVKLIEEGKSKKLPLMVFVGMKGWGVDGIYRDLTTDFRIKNKIIMLHNVSDHDLMFLYKKCLFTVFPSLYEGWGLPVAESMLSGKFCLCSKSSSIPEVGGDLLEYLYPWDVVAWADRIYEYSTNEKLLREKEEIIKNNFKMSDWKSFSELLIDGIN